MTITADPFTPPVAHRPAASSPVVARPADDDVAYLAAMSDDEFATFVLEHLGREEPERIWRTLCHPDLIDDTAEVLRAKLAEVNEQAARMKAQLAGDPAGYEAWRTRSGGFQALLERRLRQVRFTSQAHGAAEQRAAAFESLARRLALAVNGHRLACVAADLAPELHDVALWGLLDNLSLPVDRDGSEPLTVAEALCRGIWREVGEAESS